jgi:hypothetical protein
MKALVAADLLEKERSRLFSVLANSSQGKIVVHQIILQ